MMASKRLAVGPAFTRTFTLASCIVALTAVAGAQTFPSHDVTIDVAVTGGKASVREEYVLTAVPASLDVQYLANQCALLRTFEVDLDGRSLTFEESVHGPWVTLRPISPQLDVPRAARLVVHYDVDLGGIETSVPIVMPSAVLARAERSGAAATSNTARGANVIVTVTFDGAVAAGAVLFPRFEQLSGETWRATLLAMPSAVRVRMPSIAGTTECEPEAPGPTGGLEWRFWLFAGLMALCVPLYLWVFGRQTETGA